MLQSFIENDGTFNQKIPPSEETKKYNFLEKLSKSL